MLRVLVLEDDLSIADLLSEALEASGHIVTGIATTIDEALEMFELDPCDCAIIDIHLASGDCGRDAARLLRNVANIGVIFSTGNDDPTLSAAHGDAVFVKPYRMRDVGRAIEIINDFRALGRTNMPFPRNFRCLSTAAAVSNVDMRG
jgi:CheY-like chemotaxis protein